MKKPEPKINPASVKEIITQSVSTPTLEKEEDYLDKELDRELRREDLKTKRQLNAILEENKDQRKKYGVRIFWLTCIWAILIFLIIFFQGFRIIKLNSSVLITLITTTTINFFGFFLLVIKYLFNSKEHLISSREHLKSE